MELKAGFGKAELHITQKDLPIREFESIIQPLTTRVAILGEKENKCVILSIDMTSLTDRDVKKIKKEANKLLKIPEENIWVTVTHTFSAPHLKHEIKTEKDQKIYDSFFKKIVESIEKAIAEAKQDYQDVQVGWNEIFCPLNVNRNIETQKGWWLGRNFTEYSNHKVRIIGLQDKSGRTNLLYNYDIQPSVLDHICDDNGKRVISSDIFGYASMHVEESLKNVSIPLIGAAGDQMPLFKGKATNSFNKNQALVMSQGQVLTQVLLQGINSLRFKDKSLINTFTLKCKLPAQVQKLGTFEIKPTHKYEFEKTTSKVLVDIKGIQIGDCLILGTQPELNSEFAAKISALLRKEKVMIVTLVDGARKYLPEKKDFDRVTYQAMNTSIGKDADQEMLKAFTKVNEYWKGEN